MGVNRYKNHLVVFLEDEPYRDIMNGVKLSEHVNDHVLDIRNPLGGWPKVFEALDNNASALMEKYSDTCYILLLMDFDDKIKNSCDTFQKRMDKFNKIVQQKCSKFQSRIFILGANHKESEELKKIFNITSCEEIGAKLVEDCPDGSSTNWNNYVLNCNKNEIQRMKSEGVFRWLFNR